MTIQGVFLLEMGDPDEPFTDGSIKTAEITTGDPSVGFVGFLSKLVDKHLEFRGKSVGSSLGSLAYGFRPFDDVGLAVRSQMLFALIKTSREGRGLISWYVLMYQTFASSLSQVAARRVCLSAGISARSTYSSTLNVQAVTVAIDVSFPSNLSCFVILIESGTFDGSSGSDCVSVSDGVSFSDCVSDSGCLSGDSSICLWNW